MPGASAACNRSNQRDGQLRREVSSMLDESVAALLGRYVDPSPHPVWDALWEARPIGRIALAVWPNAERIERVKQRLASNSASPSTDRKNGRRTGKSRLPKDRCVCSRAELPGDRYQPIAVPRFVHGQSQGIVDVFGARPEQQPDGNVFAHPLPPTRRW